MSRDLIQIAGTGNERLLSAFLELIKKPDATGRLMTAVGGTIFEDWLESESRRRGFEFENVSKRRLPYDLIINGYRVQSKSSAKPGNSFCTRPGRPRVGSRCRLYHQSDFDIVAINLAFFDEQYFVPVAHFKCPMYPGRISGRFRRDKFSEWKDAWNVFSGEWGGSQIQKKLF